MGSVLANAPIDSIGFLLACHWIPIGIYWIQVDSIRFLLDFYWILLDSIGFLLDCCWIPIRICWILLDPIATVCSLPSPARVRVEAHFLGQPPAHEPRMNRA